MEGAGRREGGRLLETHPALRTAWFSGFRCRPGLAGARAGLEKLWTEGEAEGLQPLGTVVVVCPSLKLLHYLGLIDLSDGKRTLERPVVYGNVFRLGLLCK